MNSCYFLFQLLVLGTFSEPREEGVLTGMNESTGSVNHTYKHYDCLELLKDLRTIECNMPKFVMKKKMDFCKELQDKYQYDICVVGAGTSGLTAALEASKYCLVALCDFNPEERNVDENVEGIGTSSRLVLELLPKLHLHEMLFHSKKTFVKNWKQMVTKIKEKVNRLVRNNLEKVNAASNIRYFNEKAELLNNHTLKLTRHSGLSQTITAKKIIIATGTEIIKPLSTFGVTSDEIFCVENQPGKTLIIGECATSLEYAGILSKLGVHCTISTMNFGSSIELDGKVMEKLKQLIRSLGVRIISKIDILALKSIKKSSEFQIIALVYDNDVSSHREFFDLIVYADSRRGRTSMLNLSKLGLQVDRTSNKIIAEDNGITSISNVFIIGSVLNDHRKANSTGTETAIQLIRNLCGLSWREKNKSLLPHVVMTPLEYACVGYTEEKAELIFGKKGFYVFQTHFNNLYHSHNGTCLMKLICTKETEEKIIGVHIVAPHAGDILQIVITCIAKCVTREDINSLVNNWKSILAQVYFERN